MASSNKCSASLFQCVEANRKKTEGIMRDQPLYLKLPLFWFRYIFYAKSDWNNSPRISWLWSRVPVCWEIDISLIMGVSQGTSLFPLDICFPSHGTCRWRAYFHLNWRGFWKGGQKLKSNFYVYQTCYSSSITKDLDDSAIGKSHFFRILCQTEKNLVKPDVRLVVSSSQP